MEPGEIIETAWWASEGGGSEKDAREIVAEARSQSFSAEGWTHSPVQFERVTPGHHRLALPPDELRGRNPVAVVGWAVAVAPVPQTPSTQDMTDEDLANLRRIVRMKWRDSNPGQELGDAACDAMIDHVTPSVVRAMLQ